MLPVRAGAHPRSKKHKACCKPFSCIRSMKVFARLRVAPKNVRCSFFANCKVRLTCSKGCVSNVIEVAISGAERHAPRVEFGLMPNV